MFLPKKWMLLFLTTMALTAATGCLSGDALYTPEPGMETYGREPPPWAPAHGYRAIYHYRYYPDSQVYYSENKGAYFYSRDGRWDSSRHLPDRIDIDTRNYVTLEMDTDRPYRYHSDIKKQYPPRHHKKHKEKDRNRDPEPDMREYRQRPPHSRPEEEANRPSSHDHRAKYQYRYYPDSQVYYNENKGVYSYRRNGDWDTAGSLPDRITIDTDHYVPMELDTDRPYRYHPEIKKKYPPEKNKDKDKGKDKNRNKGKNKRPPADR